jgi:type IV pilus assembly protein PilO
MEVSSEVQGKLDGFLKLPKAVRAGVTLAIAGLVAAGYVFGVYQNSREELVQLHTQEQELQRKLSEVRSVASNVEAFELEIDQLEARLKLVIRQLPNKKQLEVLLTDISNLGKKVGIEIKSFRRQEEVVRGFYAEVPIAISIEGTYHDIARFFDMMARLPRIVNMGALTMGVVKENTQGTWLRISGIATTFRFVEGGNV